METHQTLPAPCGKQFSIPILTLLQVEAVQQQAMSLAREAHATTSAVEDAFLAAEQELQVILTSASIHLTLSIKMKVHVATPLEGIVYAKAISRPVGNQPDCSLWSGLVIA